MHTTLFVFLKCTIQGWPKVDVLLFLQSWLIFWDGSDKYWIVPVRKLFYFYHWLKCNIFQNTHNVLKHIINIGQLESL